MVAPTFRKRERIVSKHLIETLFGGGDSLSVTAFPLKAVYMQLGRHEGDEPVQVLVSVPKKRFKHAVDRNRVKRQVREAYRLNKGLLMEQLPDTERMLLAFIWLADRHYQSQDVTERVVSVLQRIAGRL
ncbi:MAG: ribonuclease P protein component [Prevotella sp.]|nr:ribonuclease P protein component [Prevotella sp.]